jgi:chemotaxis protein CheZ
MQISTGKVDGMSDSVELQMLQERFAAQELQMSITSASQAGEPDKDAPVFERLGYIVRSLHDALHEIGADKVLMEAASEFPSARERLLHIANLTENAANTVLTKVEETLPIQDKLVAALEILADQFSRLPSDANTGETFQPLKEHTETFIAQTSAGAKTTRAALSDIMMAQDFQDLTGQLIKKVVGLLERTEKDLLKLLIDAAPPGTVTDFKKEEMMAGPGAPGGVALEQASVDDLLADLGF